MKYLTDKEIITALTIGPTVTTYRQLAGKLDLPYSTLFYRLKGLRDKGIITGGDNLKGTLRLTSMGRQMLGGYQLFRLNGQLRAGKVEVYQ